MKRKFRLVIEHQEIDVILVVLEMPGAIARACLCCSAYPGDLGLKDIERLFKKLPGSRQVPLFLGDRSESCQAIGMNGGIGSHLFTNCETAAIVAFSLVQIALTLRQVSQILQACGVFQTPRQELFQDCERALLIVLRSREIVVLKGEKA